ncbi:hypothetical protein KF840_25390 [bacterium]|nr:hypothetical protein [bacterium]
MMGMRFWQLLCATVTAAVLAAGQVSAQPCSDNDDCTPPDTCIDGTCQVEAPTGVPTGTATATLTPTATGVPTGTATATETPTGIPTGTATATVTPTGIPTGTATATITLTPTATGIPTGTATATPTGIPTGTATATVTPTGIPTGTATATVTPTGIPTGTATATATPTSGSPTATRTNTPTVVIPATSTATATQTPLPVVASIIVGNATGEPGASTSFDVSLETAADIAGVQVDIAFDAAAAIAAKGDGKPDCAVNPEIEKNATSFAFLPSGCTPGEDCTAVRAIVLALENLDPIPNGSRLFTCTVAIAADAIGTYPLACSNAGAGDTNGDKVGADCSDGMITVAIPTDATIVVGDVIGAAGQNAPMAVSLVTEVSVAGTQNDTLFPSGVGVVADNRGRPTCAVNPEIDKGGTSFAFLPNGCTPGTSCQGVRALVLALDNVNPIPSGSVLFTCEVNIAPTVEDGTYPLTCENAGASDPDGNAIATGCDAGDVIVGVQPTPTETPSASPSVTPTSTPTATPEGMPTFTSTATPPPTSTSTASPTRTRKPSSGNDDDSCQVVAPREGGAAWILLLPIAALLWRRRR